MSEIRKVWIKSLSENLELILPVTPFINFKESMNINSQDLFGFGEIDNGSTQKLDTWSCESFFPDINNNYEFDLSEIKYGSEYYVSVFSRWMKSSQILLFDYYSPTKVLNSYYCKIVGFSHGEKNGNKDVHYTLDFREYKQLKIGSQYVQYASTQDIISKYGNDTYMVAEGDTLITIASKIYGDSTKWSYLMYKNSLQNPLNIEVGQTLKL